ncbi:response regulator transcription factor [Desulfuribacillus alkaliarsenatis]|uniref:DNA-binding response regulator n=1 Tax=Desulfuribacillus alkaliarsenatis TaxID=766136 RepID=A0A1E5G5P8_9FIRM|nr:response regulator transcription factor [Desulfuribacillus alkaliarsenatis]OEF98502.1 DNA-binding response regulator [Desulfuribacillus alkaliarsenatis]
MEETKKILIVDDEDRIRQLLKLYLEREGFIIEEADEGLTAYNKILNGNYDLVLLDIMLPGMDGWEICQKVRETMTLPIVLLTAKGEEENRIHGFELGADDYVVKPFSPREVVMRVKALLKRSSATAYLETGNQSANVLIFPDIIIDHDAHAVQVNGQEVSLTPKEYDLLYYIARKPDKVFSREELLKEVWNYDFFGDLRTVDTHVKRLREKLGKISPDAEQRIATVWGVGYKFKPGKIES